MALRMVIDGDRAFGIRWRDWGRLAVASWIAVFVLAWLTTLLMWIGVESGLRVLAVGLGGMLVGNVVPGMAALATASVRERLLRLPEAAALSHVVISAVVGFVGTAGLSVQLDEGAGMAVAAMVIGTMAFPLTFGMVFPLAITLVCAVVVWNDVRSRGAITRRMYWVLTCIGSAGWLGVGLAGLVLGKA